MTDTTVLEKIQEDVDKASFDNAMNILKNLESKPSIAKRGKFVVFKYTSKSRKSSSTKLVLTIKSDTVNIIETTSEYGDIESNITSDDYNTLNGVINQFLANN